MSVWCLKSLASRMFAQLFVQAQIKEKITDLCDWTLWGNPSVTGGFPSQRASIAACTILVLQNDNIFRCFLQRVSTTRVDKKFTNIRDGLLFERTCRCICSQRICMYYCDKNDIKQKETPNEIHYSSKRVFVCYQFEIAAHVKPCLSIRFISPSMREETTEWVGLQLPHHDRTVPPHSLWEQACRRTRWVGQTPRTPKRCRKHNALAFP